MKILRVAAALVGIFTATGVLAGNYELEGELPGGWVVTFTTDAGNTVTLLQVKEDSSIANYTTFENENCEVVNDEKEFRCPATGKSPLAGTKYRFVKIVSEPEPTEEECSADYALYECVKGCSRSIHTPPLLKSWFGC